MTKKPRWNKYRRRLANASKNPAKSLRNCVQSGLKRTNGRMVPGVIAASIGKAIKKGVFDKQFALEHLHEVCVALNIVEAEAEIRQAIMNIMP